MNGSTLTLGLVAGLALGATVGKRGSRATAPFVSQHGPYTITVMFQPAAPGKRNASGRAEATLNGSEIGEVVFEDYGRLYVQWSSVDKDHRRQGLASAMYDAIERATRLPLTSGDIASSLGALGLWIKRGKLTREQALERYGEWVSRDEEFSEGSAPYEQIMTEARRALVDPARGSRATTRPPIAFRDLAAWTTWARTQGVNLRLAKTPSYTVEITDLFADATGTGAGTRVMRALVRAADKAGMPLTLHPSSRRNITFYERFGFVVTGRDGMMRREPKRGSRATDPTSTPAFRRWFGDSQVVNEAGRPLIVYHGTDFTGSTSFTGKGGGKGLSKFASRSKAHLGFHFGTAAAANEKITEDRAHWMDRKRSKPVALFDDAHRDRVRMQVTQRERELEGRAKRIRAAISDRQPPAELEELAAAYESELPDAIAAYWRMRDTKTVPPTPQETRELQEIRTQQDALAEVLSATFAWARPGENILPVYLSIQRPARMNDANWGDVRQIRLKNPGWDLEAKNLKELRAELEDLGYDGIVYENRVEDVGSTSWIAFRPEQIKSATGNRGTFSPDDPRVNFNRSPR